MKLNMWILADRLSQYVTRQDIIDGSVAICGVRFVSEGQAEFSQEYVYIGRASEILDDESYQSTVVLVHGYDMLFIDGQSVEDVINSVLTSFEFYNSWEASLWAAAKFDDAIQRMVNLSEDVMNGPIGVASSTGRILAYTWSDGPQRQNPLWQSVNATGFVPQSITSSEIRDKQGNVLSDWATRPRIYVMDDFTCIGAQITVDGEYVAAFFMQEFDKTLTQGEVRLAAVFCEALSALPLHNAGSDIQSKGTLLAALLEGQTPDGQIALKLASCFQKDARLTLVLLSSSNANINIVRRNTLLETIRGFAMPQITTVYQDAIICVIQDNSVERFLSTLAAGARIQHYILGISLPFDGWASLTARYKQAQFAVSRADGQGGIHRFSDYAFNRLILGAQSASQELELLHPALFALAAYDRKHGTELNRTLEAYLKNERNMVKTAEELYVHRNSMKYRIRRIRELTGVDLEDARQRLYLLLSYVMNEHKTCAD